MERNVVTRGRVGVIAVSVALGGCYDLERLDPGPKSHYLLIDDFEDGDDVPSVSQFGSWRGKPFTETDIIEPPEVTDDHDSKHAFAVRFELHYPGPGTYSGMSLGVSSDPLDPIDARVFRSFHFSARFVPSTPFSAATEFYVQLGCENAPGLPGQLGPFWIEHNIELGPEWKAQSLSIEAFGEPSNVEPRIDGGAPACLAMANGVRFTVSTFVGDDEVLTGSLFIDDVQFE